MAEIDRLKQKQREIIAYHIERYGDIPLSEKEWMEFAALDVEIQLLERMGENDV